MQAKLPRVMGLTIRSIAYKKRLLLTTIRTIDLRRGEPLRRCWSQLRSRCSTLQTLTRVPTMDGVQNARQSSSSTQTTRVARKDEVNYALVQDMGDGFWRHTVEISALGTTFNMVYGEWKGKVISDEECPVVVCVHGTPATEGAFRPIGSSIAAKGYRVLAVNFPGNGYTKTDPGGCYDFSTAHKAVLVKAFISALQLQRVAMVIGHSSGSHVVATLACDPELQDNVQSVCFLCGTGIRPYGVQKKATMVPYLPYLLYRAMYVPILGWFLTSVFSKVVHMLGFRGRTPESQVLSIYEAYQLRFDTYTTQLSRMAERGLPLLLLFSQNDTIIEAESIPDTIAVLGIPDQDIRVYDQEGCPSHHHTFQDGTLRRVACFTAGTHRVQFKNPEQTTEEIVSLLDALRRR